MRSTTGLRTVLGIHHTVSPPVSTVCARSDDAGNAQGCLEYQVISDSFFIRWNILDYPALIFPTGLQCGPEDEAEANYEPRNEKDEYNHDLCKPCSSVELVRMADSSSRQARGVR